MSPSSLFKVLLASATLVAAALSPAPSPEEGMWTFDNLPLKQLKEQYQFEPTKEWIDHVRLSSIKFESEEGGGGSSSFVSPNGLLMTNHHVAMGTLQKLYNERKSTDNYDYVANGFSAKAFGQEVKAPGFRLKQLLEIKDFTKELAEKTKDLPVGERAKTRASFMKEQVEKLTDKSKNVVAEAVALYQGSVNQVYVYRTYEDIRLVFAPEKQVAFYGGDYDNFTYPRYCLDCAFFRVYENDKPLDTSKNFFKWSVKGAQNEELVFVPGNPGTTNRLMTFAEMEVQRDIIAPANVQFLRDRMNALDKQMKADAEKAKSLRDEFFGVSNSLKAWEGQLQGLRNAEMMAAQKAKEEDFIRKAADPAVNAAFESIAKAQYEFARVFPRSRYYRLPGLVARGGQAPSSFEKFIKAVKEGKTEWTQKLELRPNILGALQAQLEASQKGLPADDAFVKCVLGERTPEATIAAFEKSKLFDEAYRLDLLKGGLEALEKADDPLLVAVREVQKIVEGLASIQKNIEETRGASYDVIAAARFKVFGTSIYPDATFTLRLSYGTCKEYIAGTTKVPWKTTITGLFERNASFDNAEPYELPKRWTDARSKLELDTPYNFVCTTDIIGGNSGSPIINRQGEAVGLVFDGNIESLPGAYWFDARVNRTVAVHTAGMTECLKKVYEENDLVAELIGSK
jgi:hypothetical protein